MSPPIEELEKLAEMLREDLITQQEFEQQKKRLLSNVRPGPSPTVQDDALTTIRSLTPNEVITSQWKNWEDLSINQWIARLNFLGYLEDWDQSYSHFQFELDSKLRQVLAQRTMRHRAVVSSNNIETVIEAFDNADMQLPFEFLEEGNRRAGHLFGINFAENPWYPKQRNSAVFHARYWRNYKLRSNVRLLEKYSKKQIRRLALRQNITHPDLWSKDELISFLVCQDTHYNSMFRFILNENIQQLRKHRLTILCLVSLTASFVSLAAWLGAFSN